MWWGREWGGEWGVRRSAVKDSQTFLTRYFKNQKSKSKIVMEVRNSRLAIYCAFTSEGAVEG